MLYDIELKSYFPFEVDSSEEIIEVGKFKFSKSAFQRGQAILLDKIKQPDEWLIIDEIGKIEVRERSGFEPAIGEVIEYYKSTNSSSKLVLVIRDYLLKEAIELYGLQEAQVVSTDFFKTNFYGLVLCGGKSSRMGVDKAFVNYYDKPQYIHAYGMLRKSCEQVFVSCNKQQKMIIPTRFQKIEDLVMFENAGPMTGLLSAFNLHPEKSFFVMGCDYPFLNKSDVDKLIESRDGIADVICFSNPETGYFESVVAIYEKSCASLLLDSFKTGNNSLQQFLKEVNTRRLVPDNLRSIKSIDTMEDFEKLMKTVNR